MDNGITLFGSIGFEKKLRKLIEVTQKKMKNKIPPNSSRIQREKPNRGNQPWLYVVVDFVLVLSGFVSMKFYHSVNFLATLNLAMLSL